MGVPESGTQHATSTDYDLPLNRPADPYPGPGADPSPEWGGSTPLAPTPPVYGDSTELAQPAEAALPMSAEDSSGRQDAAAPGGVMGKVKAFADQRPELFLGVALLAGWLVGRLFSSSDDRDD